MAIMMDTLHGVGVAIAVLDMVMVAVIHTVMVMDTRVMDMDILLVAGAGVGAAVAVLDTHGMMTMMKTRIILAHRIRITVIHLGAVDMVKIHGMDLMNGAVPQCRRQNRLKFQLKLRQLVRLHLLLFGLQPLCLLLGLQPLRLLLGQPFH